MKKIRTRNRIFRVNTPASFGILCALILLLIAGVAYGIAMGVVTPAIKQAAAAKITPAPEPTELPVTVTPELEAVPGIEDIEGGIATTIDPSTGELVTTEPEEEPSADTAAETLPLSGVTVAVDAGKSSGGKHKGVESGTYEYKINLIFAEALQQELEKQGATVIMTRTDNEKVISSSERITTVNSSSAALLVSLFCNDIDSSKTRGAEAFVAKNNSSVESSKKLASAVLNSYTEGTGMPIRITGAGTLRLVSDKDVLTGVNVPAVGLVLGQLSNRSDDANLNDSAFVTKAAETIVKGIRSYLGK